MPKGPNRQILDSYLDSAQEGQLRTSGRDWKRKALALDTLARAIKVGAEQAELQIGEQSLTGPALRKGMEDTSVSMTSKSEQLDTAGEALVQVATQIADTREARDTMKDLGDKPSPYQPPAGTPGVPLTSDEINAQTAASQTRQGERTSWQDAFDRQEARALALTKQMDSSFLGAIPPMKAIHGQEDPTEPPPNVPSGPGGPLLPGTQVPTGGGGGGTGDEPRLFGQPHPGDPEPKDPEPKDPEPKDPEPKDPEPKDPEPKDPEPKDPETEPEVPHLPPTTTVIGTSQTGVTYHPGGPTVSAPVSGSPSAAGMPSGAAMGAAGMAGAAGALSAGGVRGGSAPAAPGRSASAPVRAIGSTGRSGSASALSRSASAGSAAARPTTSGSASGTRAGAPGSAAGRGGAAGARGAGAAGARGAGGPSAAGSAAGGRGGRKGDRDATTDRDALVYDQDWLGDDEVAPGVLD